MTRTTRPARCSAGPSWRRSRGCASEYEVLAITDEIYEHIVYGGAAHIPLATIPGMEDRTITISALSKTYSVTGWRVGWAIAPPDLTDAIRRVHDFLTVGAPTPLQEAGAVALRLPDAYYRQLAAGYLERRDLMLGILDKAGLRPITPAGAYYVMTDCVRAGLGDDTAAATAPGPRGQGGRGARLVLLLPARTGPLQAPVLVQQEAGHHRRGRPAARPARARLRRPAESGRIRTTGQVPASGTPALGLTAGCLSVDETGQRAAHSGPARERGPAGCAGGSWQDPRRPPFRLRAVGWSPRRRPRKQGRAAGHHGACGRASPGPPQPAGKTPASSTGAAPSRFPWPPARPAQPGQPAPGFLVPGLVLERWDGQRALRAAGRQSWANSKRNS